MGTYIIRRFLWIIPNMLVVYTLTFFLMHATPGGPWDESDKPLPAKVIENLNKQYRLNDPLWKQYIDYLWKALHGDFGPSYRHIDRDVSEILSAAFPVSVKLGLASMLLSLVMGVPLGTIAAIRQNSWIDFVAMLAAVSGLATPPYVRVSLLIVLFSLMLRWLPTGGWNGIFDVRAIIPILALGLGPAALITRYVRSSLLEVIRQDYMRTARAKGLTEWIVIVRHALKNALIPVVTVSGAILANVIIGAFFVETIYNVPGIGRHFVNSVTARDYPVLMGCVLLFALLISCLNLLVDLSYAFLDPRIRYQ
ncbi:MAG: ABC transporter permease [Candidatus Tectomicrobia bacterium]|nr:ABC transporter permease [Candidatus Tectomicrobia bacterium]